MTPEIVEIASGKRLTVSVWKAGIDGEMPPILPQLNQRVTLLMRRWSEATPLKDDKPTESFVDAMARLHVEICHEIMHAQSDAVNAALMLTRAVSGEALTPEQIGRTQAAARARIVRKVEAEEAAKLAKRKRRVKP